MMTMFEAQAIEFPFVERLPKREKTRLGNLWEELREASKDGLFLPPATAARLLDVSRQRVYDLIEQGTLKTVDFDGGRYVTEASIVAFCQTERKAGRPVGIPTSESELIKRAVQAGMDHVNEARKRRKR